jgi:predicted nucleic acid-binding protein
MILYLDTSALVKLYVKKLGSQAVRALLERAQVVSTSRVAYVEMRASLARKLRQGEVSEEEYRHILSDFEKDWKHYFVIEISKGVAQSENLREKTSSTDPRCLASYFSAFP